MIKRNIFGFICLFLALAGLQACFFKSRLDRNELMKYLNTEANGTVKHNLALGTTYKLVYKPTDLIIEQMMRACKNCSYDSLKSMYADKLYFTLSMSNNGQELLGGQSARFNDLLKKLSFGMQESVTMKENDSGKEYLLYDCVFPRLYGSTEATTGLLCFKTDELKKLRDFTVYVEDFVNDSPERLKFKFRIQDLEKVPQLNRKSDGN